MARLTDAQAREALKLALQEASRQLQDMPTAEVMTDDDLTWSFDGPGRSWVLVEGERLEATSDGVPVVLKARLTRWFRVRGVERRRVVISLH